MFFALNDEIAMLGNAYKLLLWGELTWNIYAQNSTCNWETKRSNVSRDLKYNFNFNQTHTMLIYEQLQMNTKRIQEISVNSFESKHRNTIFHQAKIGKQTCRKMLFCLFVHLHNHACLFAPKEVPHYFVST